LEERSPFFFCKIRSFISNRAAVFRFYLLVKVQVPHTITPSVPFYSAYRFLSFVSNITL
jgi:hypothetical protein